MNDLVQRLNTIHGIKCLLYADYLLIWTVTPKKKLVPLTEKLLNQALISLGKVVRSEKLTSQKHIMKALRLITGAVKTSPIDAMLLCTGICH
ncbi:hypothetical protein CEXT_493461 [Caerostris extrusa]|uniref:Reverse transcriptase domain-containing protein n=1 Tax=Caerostris extrusa TaxID=172846 RepID=A0AAV4WCB9_CAEEX|nr:hypothetical protein CEXT_493461 [Caerostris extrusa]